ncbi:hypothetical protein BDV96DRAFT_602306 [Lophiotrema nucula]|uniref:Uncharacterized protein n=1 Tax=Lophiotrema nucula TaxID=690887 RepID=A0A6A5YYY5_9PLEO|nr:hypothetical protein BDV96DRAFT_602306 [Lophiotrema nucula]
MADSPERSPSLPRPTPGQDTTVGPLIGNRFQEWGGKGYTYPSILQLPEDGSRVLGLPSAFANNGVVAAAARENIRQERGPQRHKFMSEQFTKTITSAKAKYLAARNDYTALGAAEKPERKAEFEGKLEPIGQELQVFQDAPSNEWMFKEDTYEILVQPPLNEEGQRRMAELRAMRAGLQIVVLLVKTLTTKLVDEPYLPIGEDGFFDFEKYVKSAGESAVEDGGVEFQERKMPEGCVKNVV